jgi:gluconate 2-dehydrogenase gamma chain
MAEKIPADPTPSETASSLSRRNLFHIIGAVPAAAALAEAESHTAHTHAAPRAAATSKGPYKRQTFDDHQWRTVEVLSDLLLPADEHSGSATQAGVPEFLDDWIAFRTEQEGNQDLRAEILGGLMWLDRESRALCQKDFADAPVEQQKKLLDRIAYPKRASQEDQPGVAFFSEFRSMAVGGYFSSKLGVAALPYLGNVAVREWKGCDPKVWAIIEERMKNGYKGILEVKPWSTA